ncbi:MAG: hypothetical protein ACLRWQ_13000 [Flavonifractor plautii]
MQLIPRLYDATEGTRPGGRRGCAGLRSWTPCGRQVAMVLQKNVLFSGTIKENLRWGKKDATDEEMVRVCKLAQADSFIQEFPDKYDTYIEQGGTNVSGGQKQRPVYRQGPAEETEDPDSGRFHLRRGSPRPTH